SIMAPQQIEISESAVSESVKKREKARRRESEKNHLRRRYNANFSLRSGRPGMNSKADTPPNDADAVRKGARRGKNSGARMQIFVDFNS
ncbi:MAG TPA: hypothetical protein PKV82_06705, partial [Anaerolineae bacterium]|nr:hypothetical protein [Anaerolineae bacterium]